MVKEDRQVPSVAEALAIRDTDLRNDALSKSLDIMFAKEASAQNERDWSFLTESLLRAENLPATAFDVFKVLATKPQLLVRCLFRLETAPRQILWCLDDQLPFSWLLIRRQVWRNEAENAYAQLRNQLTDIMEDDGQIAREHVLSILSEGTKRYPALETISTDFESHIETGMLSPAIVSAVVKERDAAAPHQIRLRARLDDWPSGYGRNEWQSELGEIPPFLWRDKHEHRARQPFFDTPVAAAWCCFKSRPTDRTSFLIKRIRAHAPDWFDLAYSATWFILAHLQDKGRGQ